MDTLCWRQKMGPIVNQCLGLGDSPGPKQKGPFDYSFPCPNTFHVFPNHSQILSLAQPTSLSHLAAQATLSLLSLAL